MTRRLVTIPLGTVKALDFSWSIDWRNAGSQAFNSGTTNTAYEGFPRWVGQPQVFVERGKQGQWRAVQAVARGKRNIFRIPIIDPETFYLRETGTANQIANGLTFASGVTFANGKGFLYQPYCFAALAAPAGATELRVDASSCGGVAPKAGQIMSANDWPFVVTYVSAVGGTVYDIGVEMPLREAIDANDAILMRGHGRFQAVDDAMGRSAYGASRHSTLTLSFQEVLAR